jgi:hypothetical protein
MKIALGMRLQSGPFGGGNQFGRVLSFYLIKHGVDVVFDLKDNDIDIILLTSVRPFILSCAFGPTEILNYLKKNPDVILVLRINECDKNRNTKTLNKQISLVNSMVDHTIYISQWLLDLFKSQKLEFSGNYSVIRNGADPILFPYSRKVLPRDGKIKIVTHHWSPNEMKGWDVYLKLDRMLEEEKYASKLEFHYIGRAPQCLKTKNIVFHDPCSDKALGDKIGNCHIYLTASINESAGMHHIEGALCGLPLLYRKSGALPEYCSKYGVAFNGVDDFAKALDNMIESYNFYSDEMVHYNNTSENMCSQYLKLFNLLYEQKNEIIASRKKKMLRFLTTARLRMWFFYFRILNKLRIN